MTARKIYTDLTDHRADVRRLNGKGFLDREIAEELSISRHKVTTIRRLLGLPRIKRSWSPARKRAAPESVSVNGYRAGQLLSDSEIARLYNGQRY